MQLIDIGVNLTHPSLAREREAVLERARAAGVCQLVLTDKPAWRKASER